MEWFASKYLPSCILQQITNSPDFINELEWRDCSGDCWWRQWGHRRVHLLIQHRRRWFTLSTGWSLIQVRCDQTSHYTQQGFHWHTNRAVPILSLHALHFQIVIIYLQQWHHHFLNANSYPSSTNFPIMTVHHLSRPWCFPPSLVETRIFHNPRPLGTRTFHNTKRLHLR